MSVKFEWHTDKDDLRGEEPPPDPGRAVSQRRWLVLIIGFMLLAAAVGVVFGWLNQQAKVKAESVSVDILAAYALVQEAAVRQDRDLLDAALLPYYPAWQQSEHALLDRGWLLNRPSLNLWAGDITGTVPRVSLAPDFQSAVVTSDLPYFALKTGGLTETVILQQTAAYEWDKNQWWLAPLPENDDFWGSHHRIEGDILSVIFRQRDADLVRTLFLELENKIKALCQIADANCPPVFTLELKFQPQIDQLLNMAGNYQGMTMSRSGANDFRLILPSPTLVGLPVDETGEQALVRGYAGWVSAILLAEFNRAESPGSQRALMKDLLAQIDLLPPSRRQTSPWQTEAPSPIPLPDQDLLVVCKPNADRPEYWRYQVQKDSWLIMDKTRLGLAYFPDLFDEFRQYRLLPLPDNNGALILTRDNQHDTQLYKWRGEQMVRLFTGEGGYQLPLPYFFLPEPGQNGRLLLQNPYTDGEFDLAWLDITQCPGDGCDLHSTPDGAPFWSADGRHSLLVKFSEEAPEIHLGDGEGQAHFNLGNGFSPVWLNNNAFVYIRLSPGRSGMPDDYTSEWVTVALEGGEPGKSEIILTGGDVEKSILDPVELFMISVLPFPHDPNTWILVTIPKPSPDSAGPGRIFTYRLTDKKLVQVSEMAGEFAGFSLQVVGNGRYLATFTPSSSAWQYQLYDLETYQSFSYEFSPANNFTQVDWSADGKWFVLPEGEDWFQLVAPDERYTRSVFHGLAGCGPPVWGNPE